MQTVGSGQSLLPLARLLAGGSAAAASMLAATLGCSAEVLRSSIDALRALGVDVVEKDGMLRLAAPLDLLDAGRLRSLCQAQSGLHVEVLDECDSTNAQLTARPDALSGTALACEHQSAGRGRRGRAWTSGLGGSLTFSLLWRFAAAPAALSGLPLAVAVIAATELERQGYSGIALKWPNDLLHDGRKLGGILIETTRPARQGETACIIGMGLNVRLAAGLASTIGRPVTDLAGLMKGSPPPERTTLLAGLLCALAAQLPLYQAQGLGAFRDEWLRRHAHQGRHVMLMLEDKLMLEGEAQGIAEDGALLVRSVRGLERVVSGEVSLR